MILKDRPRVIFLDFDGVVIKSNEIKDRAFENVLDCFLYAESDSTRRHALEFHYAHNALTRQEKFSYVVRQILSLDDDQLIESMIRFFGELTRAALLSCPYVEGAQCFLEYWHQRSPLYLVSATPTVDLEHTVCGRGLQKFFTKVIGAGQSKATEMLSVIDATGVDFELS